MCSYYVKFNINSLNFRKKSAFSFKKSTFWDQIFGLARLENLTSKLETARLKIGLGLARSKELVQSSSSARFAKTRLVPISKNECYFGLTLEVECCSCSESYGQPLCWCEWGLWAHWPSKKKTELMEKSKVGWRFRFETWWKNVHFIA